MIERVARALAKAEWFRSTLDVGFSGHLAEKWPGGEGQYVDERWGYYIDSARVAIEAMREPTRAMVDAAFKATDDDWYYGDKLCWDQIEVCHRAMIDAALKSTVQGDKT